MKHALTALSIITVGTMPLLAQAQDNCTSPNADGDYILGEVDGVASAMHWPSGLVWKRCSEGQTFSGGQCSGAATARDWNDWVSTLRLLPQSFANQAHWEINPQLSHNLLASGHWRMAYANELQGITTNCGNGPKANHSVFPSTPTSIFWSGSPHSGQVGYATIVSFSNGNASGGECPLKHPTRLVRGGQPFAPVTSPAAQTAAAATPVTFAAFTLAPGAGAGQAWGGARISGDGSPAFQLNGAGDWLQQAIVRSGDQVSVRLTAPASGSNVATFTLHSGQTIGTSTDASNGGSEATALHETAVNFTVSAATGPTPVAGVCGSAHGTPQLAEPPVPGGLCSSGTYKDLLPTGTGWTWMCDGQFGGASASCQAPQGFVLTPAAQANGSISPDTPATVAWGTKHTFTITAAAGYRATASGCGGTLAGSTYTTGAITADCTVTASFAPSPTYAISTTVSPAGAGSITCTPDAVPQGQDSVCSATPSAGYRFQDWGGACSAAGSDPSCTLTNVQGASTVQARFVQLAHAITLGVSPADAGRVICAPNPVPHGKNATCRALSNVYAPTAWGGDCSGQSGPLCSLANVAEAKTATVQFDTSRIPPRALNDTGVRASGAAGSGNASTCDPAHPTGQDCHYGRDTIPGGGFDYTKIANNGTELPATTALGSGSGDWACTRDNTTGLVWEVKTTNPGSPTADLRDADYLYTWYDPHSPDGSKGTQNLADHCQTQYRCTTSQFVQDVNAAGLCGARDWRLPSVQELESLLDLGRASAAPPPGSAPALAIDPDYFPNTPALPSWSSTPLADRGLLGAPGAWYVDFDPSPACGAGACVGERFLPLSVRLVRGGR